MLNGFGLKELTKTSSKKGGNSRDKIEVTNSDSEIIKLPLERCFEGDYQPRSHITDNDLQKMVNSLKLEGQHQPIIVYIKGNSNQDLTKNEYYIIAGHKRCKAASILGWKTINAIVYTKKNKAILASFTTNEVASELHPVDRGATIKKYLELGVWATQEEVANYLSCTQGTISKLLSYSDIPVEVRAKIVETNLTSSIALQKIARKFRKAKKKNISEAEYEALCFDIIEEFEESSPENIESAIKVEKNVSRSNFLYLENDEKFVIREGSIRKLNLEQREELKSTLYRMLELCEIYGASQ